MVDQLVLDAKQKLTQFENAWRGRAQEFELNKDYDTAKDARGLADWAARKNEKLDELLDEDKRLDKKYDLIKGRKVMGLNPT